MQLSVQRSVPKHRLARQRGAAALIVVMLLFFVISLTAAYTSRNLIFEQRTASNQYRATQALEAAEAGIEWTLAQLNSGLATGSCTATTTASGNPSFRQRYLAIDNTSGNVTPVSLPFPQEERSPTCLLDTSSSSPGNWKWTCVCPPAAGTVPTLTAPTGAGNAPTYMIEMLPLLGGVRPDLFQVISYSCTRFSADCVSFSPDRGGTGDGIATTRVTVALRGALTRTPAAALTVAGTLAASSGGAVLALQNSSATGNGVTLHSGGSAPSSGLALTGLPGATAASTVVAGDSSLAPPAQTSLGFAAKDLRFAALFGMQPQTYRRQPGMPILDCSGGCNAAAINTAIERNPGRPVWLAGITGTVTIDGTVGSASAPALLIVEGDVVFSGGASLTGLLYSRIKDDGSGAPPPPTVWALNGNASIVGAAVAEGNLTLGGSSTGVAITYNEAALRALRIGTGTFVRVPGSWRDFL